MNTILESKQSASWTVAGLAAMLLGSFSFYFAISDHYDILASLDFLALAGAAVISIKGGRFSKTVGIVLSVLQGLVVGEFGVYPQELIFGVHSALAFIQICLLVWDWRFRTRPLVPVLFMLAAALCLTLGFDFTYRFGLRLNYLMTGGVFLAFFLWGAGKWSWLAIAIVMSVASYFRLEIVLEPSDIARIGAKISYYPGEVMMVAAVAASMLAARRLIEGKAKTWSLYSVALFSLFVGSNFGWLGDQMDNGLRFLQSVIDDSYYRIFAGGDDVAYLVQAATEPEIIVTGTRISTAVFGVYIYPALYAASFLFGLMNPLRWRVVAAVIATIALVGEASSGIYGLIDWGEFEFSLEIGALVAPFIFAYFGAWLIRHVNHTVPATHIKKSTLIRGTPLEVPDRIAFNFRRFGVMRHSKFFPLAKSIRKNPNFARNLVTDAEFSPLQFKLSEAYYAGRIPALLGICITTVYAALLSAMGDVQQSTGTLVAEVLSDYIQSIILAAIVPLAFLFSAFANSWLLVPSEMQNRGGRRAARQLYLIFDSSYGYHGQMLAGLGFVCTLKFLGMLDFEEMELAIQTTPFLILGGALLIVGQLAQYLSLPLLLSANFYRVPISVSRTIQNQSATNRTIGMLAHALIAIMSNLFIGAILLVVGFGIPLGIHAVVSAFF